ncbi:MAG: HAD hydrolase family protein [Ignavibacteriales bacterium]|nr:HAD hydrolase family protein [Ignavibacteriales bacterium]
MKKTKTSRRSPAALKNIKLLLLDVDGVMTDGGIYCTESGDELKKFHIQDGYGIVKWQRHGGKVGIITGRVSKLVARRAQELGITEVYQNLEDKLEAFGQIKATHGLKDSEIAYIGDDEFDLPVLNRVGFSAAPRNAVPAVKKQVHFTSSRNGGDGAVREVIDLLLKARGDAT